jgi:hypothetical protein
VELCQRDTKSPIFWCSDMPLATKFADLFEICHEQKGSVAQIVQRGWRLTFRRWLRENLQNQLRELRDILASFAPNEKDDHPKWCWEKSGVSTVKSAYKQLCCNESGASCKMIWRAKLPLKIKIWMWVIEQNAMLTKDNLTKRNWTGDFTCAFCGENETISHLFFECNIAKYVWSIVAFVIGADNRPTSFEQYWY